jgi:hypothetical protein
MMKRFAMLSGACVLLGGVYAVWVERQRRRQAQEDSKQLQTWDTEGGSQTETTRKPKRAVAAYS